MDIQHYEVVKPLLSHHVSEVSLTRGRALNDLFEVELEAYIMSAS